MMPSAVVIDGASMLHRLKTTSPQQHHAATAEKPARQAGIIIVIEPS
jgi:hypothetical protein